ncbi:N5-glutamine S-adenosyl-L-methionine-dependent methyltransferase [Advenella kashmirensis WT001]|uniref:Ribosomal protein uL3 glutamine methyltransferase n=1 Tax=Advenella kashmirensis (strain DSM 17095 / LMG 22695 / WT001) TaxID=1036672 RepID=I3UD45_ADVKW|nr:50S ribosomal protein L3 N(5)-glutamine methyltransferase [Advenella kashmirensis]AFK62933.1 N5-glutamine S-adenosyl-L-methionine-dependent methyltransferase [Advenella kashmirensis WT001]
MASKIHNELKTVRDVIRYAVSRFNDAQLAFGHGSDNAWDEAVYLVLSTLHLPLDTLDPFLDARLLEDEKKKCVSLIELRVKKRVPLAYLTGEAWLQGHRFLTDKRVIVPRSPISELLAEHLEPWVDDPENVQNVLDLCTGSGCLAILAALAFPNAQVDAVDLSDHAIRLAQRNVDMYQLGERVNVLQGDLYAPLEKQRYDVIVCNPPYVNSTTMAQLPSEYQHEPALALAGGDDGMDIIRTILDQAAAHLSDDGFIILEIGNEYENFMNAFPALNPVFLETAEGDDSVLLLTREQLQPR